MTPFQKSTARPVRTLAAASAVALAGPLLVAAGSASAATAAEEKPFPKVIDLPGFGIDGGFAPEGIATAGKTAYVGSLNDGTLAEIDTRTGDVTVLTEGDGTPSVGLDVKGNRLFVAGGEDGDLTVVNRRTGERVASYQLIEPGTGFINDVIVGPDAAYATESQSNRVFVIPFSGDQGTRLPAADGFEVLELTGDYEPNASGFGLNGITTARGGDLHVVNSTTGVLYRVDTETGEATEVDITDADGEDYALTNGDGMLRAGRTLFVVQNSDNQIAKIRLDRGKLDSGTVVTVITSDEFNVPTTVAKRGKQLYLPNAKFGQETSDYEVTRVARR